ncbi:MAG: HD domain-containing protein [Saccharofermentanales bacterium]
MDILDIIKADKPSIIILELYKEKKLDKFLPEVTILDTCDKGYKNNFYHTLSVLDNVCKITNDYKIKLVALFHDIGKYKTKDNSNGKWTFYNHESVGAKMTMDIFDRLNIKDDYLRDYVYRMIYYHGRVKIHRDVSESAIRRLDKEVGQDIIFDLIEFCKCDITTKFNDKRNRIVNSLNTIKNRIVEIRQKDEESKWRSPLTGNIIMDLLNIQPCKLIGDIKKELDPKLKSGDITLDDAINEVLKYKKKED